jgi:adenosylhomocysteine nucleosidase
MGRGKRSATQALAFLGCFISATIGIVNTFRCGPWPCIGIYGRAGKCGLMKYGSKYSRPGVIEPIVESPPPASVGAEQLLSGSSVNPIAIFAATRWELQAVRRGLATDRVTTIAGVRCHIGQHGDRTYWLIQTGVGPVAAGTIAGNILKAQPMSLVMSTGFACALVPAEVGDIIVGTSVSSVHGEGSLTMGAHPVLCDGAVREDIVKVAQDAGLVTRVGPVVSSETIVWQAQEKRRLRNLTDAIGLDMESAALAEMAQAQGLPMAIVRAVSDLVDEDLPLDFNLFLRPTGWAKGMQALVSAPSSVAGLNRLRKQSRVAAARLTEWFQRYAETRGKSLRSSG